MRCLSVRFLLTSACFLLPIVAMSSSTEAGVIPWVYNAIFGPARGPYGYYYEPGYYSAGYGLSGSYGGVCCGAPAVSCRRVYACCDPCPVSCGPCGVAVAGTCGVPQCTPSGTPSTLPATPAPAPGSNNSGTSKTYAEPGQFEKPATTSGTTDSNNTAPPTPARESKQGFESDKFEQRKPRPAPTTPPDGEERETRKPAGTTDGDNSATEEKSNLKAPAATPKLKDEGDSGTEIKPASRTSQKIAWAPVLQRRQVGTQSKPGSAYIVRLPAYPKTNELRQPSIESSIAKK